MASSAESPLCAAFDKKTGIRCTLPAGDSDEWCGRHLQLQAKALKHYKAISSKLERQSDSKVSAQDIEHCPSMRALFEWLTLLRNRRNYLRRTIESRSSHHELYYNGGDDGHRGWIEKLEKQELEAERMMLEIESRAYDLTLAQEAVQWLRDPISPELCGPQPSKGRQEAQKRKQKRQKGGPAPKPINEHYESDCETQSDSDWECECHNCKAEEYIRKSHFRGLVSSYYSYPEAFEDEEEQMFARRIIENLFRFVISRTKGLLMHAKNANDSVTLEDFLLCECEGGYLREDQLKQLVEGLRHNNGSRDTSRALITAKVIRNAIKDAEIATTAEECNRTGSSIYILGGAVYQDPYPGDLSARGLDHLYRFVACTPCAGKTVATFTTYHQIHLHATEDGRFKSWRETHRRDDAYHLAVIERGGILHYAHDAGVGPKVETLLTTQRGRMGLYVERHSRSVAFLRFPLDYPFANELANAVDPDLVVWSWSGSGPMKCNRGSHLPRVWLSRECKPAGPSSVKSLESRKWLDAHWLHSAASVEGWKEDLTERYCGHEYLLPKTTIDIIVLNTSLEHPTLSSLIDKIKTLLGPLSIVPKGKSDEKDLHVKAFNLARAFFREDTRYRRYLA